jgi:hypothetical protein
LCDAIVRALGIGRASTEAVNLSGVVRGEPGALEVAGREIEDRLRQADEIVRQRERRN